VGRFLRHGVVLVSGVVTYTVYHSSEHLLVTGMKCYLFAEMTGLSYTVPRQQFVMTVSLFLYLQ